MSARPVVTPIVAERVIVSGTKCSVEVREFYHDFKPTFDVTETVNRLLTGIPPEYISGIKTVVLRDATGLSHQQRRKKVRSKKKHQHGESLGSYFPAWKGEFAWIQLLVDNVIENWPAVFLKISFFRDLAFANVLFHEIGHHIHKTRVREFANDENVAERWRRKLTAYYMRHTYWYLMPLFWLTHYTVMFFRGTYDFLRKVKKDH